MLTAETPPATGATPAEIHRTGNASAASIVTVGVSHRTASLELRERLALVGERAQPLTARIASLPNVHELVALSTCHRTELTMVTSDVDGVVGDVLDQLAVFARVDCDALAAAVTVRVDRAAVGHLMRVAAGMDSVVIGEAEILGQLRRAHLSAREAGEIGPLLDRLLRAAVEVGKEVRSNTAIGEGNASIGSVAATLVEHQLGTLTGRNVLVIGAGEMSALAARSLQARGANNVFVANRNAARASSLAEQCGGTAVPFDNVDTELVTCDVVLSSTSAPHLLLTAERIAEAMHRREGRPLVLVDLAMPRDIDPACESIRGCTRVDLDGLEAAVSRTTGARQAAVGEAERIVRAGTSEFQQWRAEQRVVPAILEVRHHAEAVRQEQVDRFASRLAHLQDSDRDAIEHLTRSIVNRLLHGPTTRLRAAAADPECAPLDADTAADALSHLFAGTSDQT